MNRTMQAKNEQRKKLERKMKKEKFYDRASHRYYAEELPKSSSFFFYRDVNRELRPWWDV